MKGANMKYNKYPKRDAIKNYFPVPNEIFNLGLRAGEIALYAFLLKCEDRKTFKCWPSYKTIGKALNISKNTVRNYVDKLCANQQAYQKTKYSHTTSAICSQGYTTHCKKISFALQIFLGTAM